MVGVLGLKTLHWGGGTQQLDGRLQDRLGFPLLLQGQWDLGMMKAEFQLHERLQGDTVEVARWELSRVLLMNDREVPWLILVPQRPRVAELHHLSQADLRQLTGEMAMASHALEKLFRPDKLNVGALGNLVPQLHVHLVARFRNDRAWPGPIWGSQGGQPYGKSELERRLTRLRKALAAQRAESQPGVFDRGASS